MIFSTNDQRVVDAKENLWKANEESNICFG
jgi:hypothetical protein